MFACNVCLRSGESVRLSLRDMSAFHTVCATSTGTLEEGNAWVCAYCWTRASQCLQFFKLARRAKCLLTSSSANLCIEAEDVYPYSKVRLDDTTICEARECLAAATALCCSAEQADQVPSAGTSFEYEIDIVPKLEEDDGSHCDPLKQEVFASPMKSQQECSPCDALVDSPAQLTCSTSNVTHTSEPPQTKPLPSQLPLFIVLPHIKTDCPVISQLQQNQVIQQIQQYQPAQQNNQQVQQQQMNTLYQLFQQHNQSNQHNQPNQHAQQTNQTQQQNQMLQINQQLCVQDKQIQQKQNIVQIQENVQQIPVPEHAIKSEGMSSINTGHQFIKIAPKPGLKPCVLQVDVSEASHQSDTTREQKIETREISTGDVNAPAPTAPPKLSEADKAKELCFELVELTLEQQKEELEKKKQSSKYTDRKYRCDKCGVAFRDEDPFILHAQNRHDESVGPHECVVCGLRFKYQYLLTNHVTDHARRWRCTRCGVMIRKRDWYEHHDVCAPHDEGAQHECDICGKSFATLFRLKFHKRKKHRPGEHKYICDICNKALIDKCSLRIHMRKHTDTRPYTCDVCGKTFMSHSSVTHHKKRHEDPSVPVEQRYCVECDKYYSTKIALIDHLTTSSKHNAKTKQCSVCSEKFVGNRSLDHHMKSVHLNARDVHCQQCDKKYCTERSLQCHIKRKHGQTERTRDHVCGACGAAFYNKKTLQAHTVAVHERRRPYRCDICGETFGFKAALYTHRKLRHKITGSSKKQTGSQSQ